MTLPTEHTEHTEMKPASSHRKPSVFSVSSVGDRLSGVPHSALRRFDFTHDALSLSNGRIPQF